MPDPQPGREAGAACATRTEEREGVFPWSLAEEVFALIRERGIRVLRYRDLEPSRLRSPSRLRYLDEYVRFNRLAFGPLAALRALAKLVLVRKGGGRPITNRLADLVLPNDSAPAIFLQHDADLLPERTIRMLELEERCGLRSSSYFFVEHAETRDYSPDFKKLEEFEKIGFEIGYHQNAFERSGYELQRALAIAAEDLAVLRRHFDIRSFVPHGGQPSPSGLNNEHLPHRGALKELLWAYNGKCILKEHTWSDGGIRKWSKTDPRAFVQRLRPGTRAVMLMHPQYYSDELRPDWQSLPVAREPWWRRLWRK